MKAKCFLTKQFPIFTNFGSSVDYFLTERFGRAQIVIFLLSSQHTFRTVQPQEEKDFFEFTQTVLSPAVDS